MGAQKTPTSQARAKAADLVLEKGLPSDIRAEKCVLGALLNGAEFEIASAILTESDFFLESHRRIWARMRDLQERGEKIDRLTVADELIRNGQLESITYGAEGGLGYLISLDEDLPPELVNIEAHARIVLEKSNLRHIIFTAQQSIDLALVGLDSSQDIAGKLTERIEVIQSGHGPETIGRSPSQVIEDFPGGISSFLDPSLRVRGLPIGLKKVDDITDGLHPGELLIIGARPSVGKSALLLNILQHLCLHPKHRIPAALFSLEMNASSIITRLMCGMARVDAHKFRLAYLNAQERRALQVSLNEIIESRLTIFDKFGITLPEVERETRRLVKKEGLKLMGLDYLQLLAAVKKGENRNLEVAEFTRRLKILAGDLNIPIIALSQLSRRNEQRPSGQQAPQLSDLRDSGSLEQDADSVWLLDREELRKKDHEDLKGLADINVAKQRNGPISVVRCRFLGQFMKFESMADDPPEHGEIEYPEEREAREMPPQAPLSDW